METTASFRFPVMKEWAGWMDVAFDWSMSEYTG